MGHHSNHYDMIKELTKKNSSPLVSVDVDNGIDMLNMISPVKIHPHRDGSIDANFENYQVKISVKIKNIFDIFNFHF